ncbi:DGQHR domain-containing protein [Mesorhizobium sp. B2-2-4]|uniref:DGQHR domain-containing protein n=1 Tax=unclassified Mesorhizobium TaxID=325217 RepID=UPI00112EA922|nr:MULTISPECIES: DGQHR domain-containing protein [unclassified Mesorhizobium]TPM56258.1 DGQHR domain-containing protein [Mesorhizobium sp. B2-2-4]TPM68305.1 DGQHR domain-containing protein [Mesorhizobium sp. B2-2-1]TPN71368.1 DGQHR domain-containing protein [Mesorhizobium sp. B1-1-3]
MAGKLEAIRFKQWLPEWGQFDFDPSQHRRKPEEHILLFSMPAVQLRALSGVYRRTRDHEGGEGLQRLHDPKRSAAIRDFVRFGHPYSSLPIAARNEASAAMRKPGWLPTAIVVNILTANDERRGRKVAASDLVSISNDGGNRAELTLPYFDRLEQWTPTDLEPFEVIDGQHRLWAFDEALKDGSLPGDFELPVVAFTGLDVGWQAYLFWSINVSPKRINPSHAFDLFPLLRSAEWLETLSDLRIYRQARAQELTEILYTQPESPFHNRINMLGESSRTAPPGAGVTQAGWVQAITTSFLSTGSGRSANGLFAAEITPVMGPLPWSRPQQAAFLIALWTAIREAILQIKHDWVEQLIRPNGQESLDNDPAEAFTGNRTMLNQEQGVRGVLAVANEIFFSLAQMGPELFEFETKIVAGTATTPEDVSIALGELEGSDLLERIGDFGSAIAGFDWRSADAPGLSDDQRMLKRAFRGSSGYVALREQLFRHLAAGSKEIAEVAEEALGRLS